MFLRTPAWASSPLEPGVLLGGIHVDDGDVLVADVDHWDLAR